jgi:hypothetical protein
VSGSLAIVRLLLLAAAIAAPSLALAQSSGTFKPQGAAPASWSINPNHTLIWNGQPYLPLGLRIDGNPADIKTARAAGVSDVIVQLPAIGMGWKEAFAELESSQMRYLIDISSLAPMAKGYAVEPQGYRISGITSKRLIDAKIPGALSALAVLMTRRDSQIERVVRMPISNGKLQFEVNPLNDLEHVLLIYPEMRSIQQADLWDAMDEHRDNVITALRKSPPGPGLRGLVNPVGTMLQLTGGELRFVPSSPYFRFELRSYLESKYKNIEATMRTWAMSAAPIEGFDHLARLVPLWSGQRGVPQLWDPETDKLYQCDSKRSGIWRDIQDVITNAATRRYQRLVLAIRGTVDVPVIQEWAGWAAEYESGTPALDGIGMRAAGTSPSEITESASRAASSITRWRKPGWLTATSVDLGGAKEATGLLPAVIDDLVSLGARGWFVEAPANPDLAKAVGALATQRAADVSAASYSPQPVYFPENAYNPASAQRLGPRWWLPSPANGNRVDLGAGFSAYRMSDGTGSYFALWNQAGVARVKLRMENAKSITFETMDGSDCKPKLVKGGVEVTVGNMPLIIRGTSELPIPESALAETLARFDALCKAAEKRRMDPTEERYYFSDAYAGFDRNPGGSFSTMRRWFWRLSDRVASYTWLEAEASRDYNFSETILSAGCSAGGAIAVQSQLNAADQVFVANYTVPVKTEEDVELWIAARIPAVRRGDVEIVIGSQVLKIEGEPVSLYGAGYGWYKLGQTRIGGASAKLQLRVNAPQGADMAFDTIVLYPGSFRPNGVTPPDAIVFPVGKTK